MRSKIVLVLLIVLTSFYLFSCSDTVELDKNPNITDNENDDNTKDKDETVYSENHLNAQEKNKIVELYNNYLLFYFDSCRGNVYDGSLDGRILYSKQGRSTHYLTNISSDNIYYIVAYQKDGYISTVFKADTKEIDFLKFEKLENVPNKYNNKPICFVLEVRDLLIKKDLIKNIDLNYQTKIYLPYCYDVKWDDYEDYKYYLKDSNFIDWEGDFLIFGDSQINDNDCANDIFNSSILCDTYGVAIEIHKCDSLNVLAICKGNYDSYDRLIEKYGYKVYSEQLKDIVIDNEKIKDEMLKQYILFDMEKYLELICNEMSK